MNDSSPLISVTGRGCVRVPPDRIVFSFELEALLPTVDDTYQQLELLRGQLYHALLGVGVDPSRIRSAGPQVSPQHEYEKQRWVYKGIAGKERITARLPFERGRATAVLRSLAAQLEQVRVTITHLIRDRRPARAEALRAAVEDVRLQAEVMAAAAGQSLGPIRELKHESCADGIRSAMAGTVADAGLGRLEGELDPTDVSVEVEVDAVWTLVAPADAAERR